MPSYSVADHTPESLEEIGHQLALMKVDIEALSIAMKQKKVAKMTVRGQAELLRAMDRLGVFISNAKKAFADIRRERGDFAASEPRVE